MQETKKRIVIASVLKPVNDTRMFEKMAQTLESTGRYEVHVIGFPSNGIISSQVKTHPSRYFKRLSFRRLAQPWQVTKAIWAIKPKLIITNSHELLGVCVTLKFLFGCKLIYDIQENYFRNILFTKAFPFIMRPMLACYVRFKEISLSPFIDYFILAEKGYADELLFIGRRKITIENKVIKPTGPIRRKRDDGLVHLLFSGTLAETTGVFYAIDLVKKLYEVQPNIRLTIIGYCAQQTILEKIKNSIDSHPAFNLVGGDYLIDHKLILEEIKQADFGIISYPPNLATENSIPTKLYEYLGYELPILLTDFNKWRKICEPYDAGLYINFSNPDVRSILYQMEHTTFYSKKPTDVFWESAELIDLVEQHLDQKINTI